MKKGFVTPVVLIIVSAFVIIIYGILLILSLQLDFSHRQTANERALYIAETGINYYRWRLKQNPTDYSGAGEYEYSDPEGGQFGKYSLEIDPPSAESNVLTITSTGWTNQYSNVKRTIKVRYGAVSLTNFSFLHNSNVWFGNGTIINGPIFSNGGVRQDGTN